MKKATRRKLLGIVLALALVIGALNMNVWNAKAEGEESTTQARPTASATGAFAEGSAEGDLTPSIQYQITHSPIGESDGKEYDLVLALDVSSSMVKNKVANSNSTRMKVAAQAAKDFVNALGENVSVSLIGFKTGVVNPSGSTTGAQIDSLAKYAEDHKDSSGTNIAAAIRSAISSLSGDNKVLVIVSDGEPYGSYSDPKSETKKALQEAKNAGIKVYAIGFSTSVDALKGNVDVYGEAADATQLAGAFSSFNNEINYRYADAWIVATPGPYMEYIGTADNVSIPENGDYEGKLVWDAATVIKVGNVQTSPAIDFAVKVGDLRADDSLTGGAKAANELAIVKALIDKYNEGAEGIYLTRDPETGNVEIKLDVTSDAKLYYSFEGTTVGPVDVDIQATATIYSGAYPQSVYYITYVVDGEPLYSKTQYIEHDYDVVPTTGAAMKHVLRVSALGDYADEDYSAPAISRPGMIDGHYYFVVEYTHNDPTPEIPETPSELESTVRFIVDGNENNPYYTETRVVGASVDVPVNPTKGGFSFRGWSLNGTDVVSVYPEHTEADVTYYAVFRENKENDDPKPTPENDKPYIPPFEEDPEEDPKEEEPVVVPEPEVPAGEPEIVVPEPEVPAGEPEVVVPEPEVPAGEPEIEIPEPEVPAGGELPQTGTTPVAVFYGIGGACIVLGGVIFIASRRKKRV